MFSCYNKKSAESPNSKDFRLADNIDATFTAGNPDHLNLCRNPFDHFRHVGDYTNLPSLCL